MPVTPNILMMTIFAVLFWLFFFLRQKSTRTEMLVIGGLTLVFSPLFARNVAEVIFSFAFAGIAAVIFQQVLGKRYRQRLVFPFKRIKPGQSWFLRLFLLALIWSWLAVFFVFVIGTQAWQGAVIAGLFLGSYIISIRRDLFFDALMSAGLMTIVLLALYGLASFRNPTGVPLTGQSILFAATVGFVLGPLYEFARNIKLSSPK